MDHDPAQIKPNADYHNREKPLILINRSTVRRPKPAPRAWKVSQYVPVVKHGLAGSGTLAVVMLNLSNLPVSASSDKCLAWARAFCQALEGGEEVKAAVEVADRAVKAGSEGKDR